MGWQRLENTRNVIVQCQRERKQAISWRSDEHQEIIVLAFANVCLPRKSTPCQAMQSIISGTHQDWLVDQAKSRRRLSSSRLPWELL